MVDYCIGMVNEDLSISLSQELQYVSNEDTSLVMNIVGLSDSLFMLLYYNGSSSNDISSVPNGPLTAMLASVDPSADPTASKPLILSSTTLEQSAISYYFSVTQLSNDTAIVAYANAATNGGITALAVRINDALEIGVLLLFHRIDSFSDILCFSIR